MGLGCHDNTFLETGPTHLMVNTGRGSSQKKMVEIDWENEDHRRCITACLVKATYVLEDEYETEATMQLAPAWWESFHFSRLGPEMFACDCVCDFCKNFGPQPNIRYSRGVVFEYVPPDGASRHPSAPRYIVAFRGTMPLHPNIFGDMRLNLRIVLNKRHLCSRFCEAHERIGELVDSTADADSTCSAVWLTGHSLGASIALEVGREMMKQGFNLPTFLYNPPHVSLEPVSNLFRVPEKAKQAVYLGGSFVKYAMAKTILRSQRKHMVTVFGKLSPWVPELYVHQRDWICNGFINQLELQEKVQKRFPKIIMSAAPLVCRDLLHRSAMFGSGIKRERLHLLPSARLWKNSSPDENAHELKQWWKPDLMLSSRLYSGLECWPELC